MLVLGIWFYEHPYCTDSDILSLLLTNVLRTCFGLKHLLNAQNVKVNTPRQEHSRLKPKTFGLGVILIQPPPCLSHTFPFPTLFLAISTLQHKTESYHIRYTFPVRTHLACFPSHVCPLPRLPSPPFASDTGALLMHLSPR